jgi:acyltransferase-like protein
MASSEVVSSDVLRFSKIEEALDQQSLVVTTPPGHRSGAPLAGEWRFSIRSADRPGSQRPRVRDASGIWIDGDMVFPEGSRSIDGRVAEFKKGAAILAYELKVPIVPVGVRGTFEAWPRGGGFRLHGAEIHIGDAIDPCSIKSADPHTDITKSLRARVKELARQL